MSIQNENTEVIIFANMLGKTFKRVESLTQPKLFAAEFPNYVVNGSNPKSSYNTMKGVIESSDTVVFVEQDESNIFIFNHRQDCCESVDLVEVIGDFSDLIGYPLLMAELVTESGEDDDMESFTWSFYKFATIKGSVTLRWFGQSNGYYSETVEDHHMVPM